MPLQSRSLVGSQPSAAGLPATHWSEPFTQCTVPFAHAPCAFAVHGAPPPGSPSSVRPSQLSSWLLHVSVWGVMLHAPIHVPLLSHVTCPFAQFPRAPLA